MGLSFLLPFYQVIHGTLQRPGNPQERTQLWVIDSPAFERVPALSIGQARSIGGLLLGQSEGFASGADVVGVKHWIILLVCHNEKEYHQAHDLQ